MFTLLSLFCASSFLGYGISCLVTSHMVREFERYGLSKFRLLTGIVQLPGGLGLLAGFRFPLLGALAAGGLALQMLLGLGVRMKIRDPFFRCLAALLYFALNAWLLARFLSQ